MAIKTIDDTHLKQIANAIREKTGSAEGISVDEMPEQIKGIKGGVPLPELENEGSASDLLSGKQLIDGDGNVVTGTIATKTSSDLTASGATVTVPAGYYATNASKAVSTATQATPSISVSSSGLITASSTQTAGYVAAGTKSATKQLTAQAAKTITPTKSSQTAVAKNVYTTGAVTVAAIPAQYITTTDATAIAADIRTGKTAYVNGTKVTGSIADFDGSYECSGESTGGGGANIETCSITITTPTSAENQLYASRLVDGEESHQSLIGRGSFGATDVICGRLFVLYSNDLSSWMGHSITTSDNVEMYARDALPQGGTVSSFVCTSGASATITLTAIDV